MRKPIVTYADFDKLDLRVGEVIKAEKLENSRNLIKLTVDLGEEYGQTTILSGIAKWYSPDQLVGKKYVFLANLEPKPMMGLDSNGMVIVADTDEQPILFNLPKKIKNGTVAR